MALDDHADRHERAESDQVGREAAHVLEAQRGAREPREHQERSEQPKALEREFEVADVDDPADVEQQARDGEHEEQQGRADVQLRAPRAQERALVASEPDPREHHPDDREAVDLRADGQMDLQFGRVDGDEEQHRQEGGEHPGQRAPRVGEGVARGRLRVTRCAGVTAGRPAGEDRRGVAGAGGHRARPPGHGHDPLARKRACRSAGPATSGPRSPLPLWIL